MQKLVKNSLLVFILFFFSTSTSLADTLTYRDTLKKAIDNSFDIKISTIDIDISKAELKSAKADLYPTIFTQVNSEYNNGLGNTQNVNYVGNTVVSSYTQYRNLAILGLSYNLFDFGAKGQKVKIAKKDIEQKKVMVALQEKDLTLKVLDLYTKILQYNNEIKTKTQILSVYEEMFRAKERLFKAGTADRISVMDEAVKLARTQDDIQSSKLELKKALTDLSSFTFQKYDPNNLEVLDFDDLNIDPNFINVSNNNLLKAEVKQEEIDLTFDPENTLESKYYDYEITKKKTELELYKRQRLPSFKFYTNYLFYGQDPSRYSSAYNDLKQASVAVGISGTYTFFDGFKNKASKEKSTLEIKKIQLEKAKKLTELQTEYEKSFESYQAYIEELTIKKNLLNKVKDKLAAVDRMHKNGFIERNELLKTKAELLNQEFELQKNIVIISSKIKELQVMTGARV